MPNNPNMPNLTPEGFYNESPLNFQNPNFPLVSPHSLKPLPGLSLKDILTLAAGNTLANNQGSFPPPPSLFK
jgi:hypothetical protein